MRRRMAWIAAVVAALAGGAWFLPSGSTAARGNGAPSDAIDLPGGRILYSAPPSHGGTSRRGRSLFSAAADGSDVRRVTFGLGDEDRAPVLLTDGRVLFERRPAGGAADLPAARMTIHPDGTGLAAAMDRGAGSAGTSPPVLTSVVKDEARTGTFLCLDVRTSEVPAVAALPPGGALRVRFTRSDGAGDLGEATVHEDGSFFVEVPADTPLRLTLLAADGRAIASHVTDIWVRPNENRACIGCHEAPDLVPENRRPQAVLPPAAALLGGPHD
ncbi:MAG: hypothetical protein HY049_10310 [Acidobacteria bacterium]|nr:hypothetical protein [Acidobacteriota bacterium]